MKPITIGVFSDIICPWCYIGKKRLERAICKVGLQDLVKLEMLAYQLYPQIPIGGIDKSRMRSTNKEGLSAKLHEEAAKENIVIDYRKINTIPNTLQAHRLIAISADFQKDVMNLLFRAYFEFGQNVESLDSLTQIATDAHLNQNTINQFTSDQTFGLENVKHQLTKAKDRGISAVPSFLLKNSFVITGVQEVNRWVNYLERQSKT